METKNSVLDLDEIRDLVMDVTFRPFAQYPWEFNADKHGNDLVITLTQMFARDSSNFDPFQEIDDWNMMEAGNQVFSRVFSWPDSTTELRRWCAEMAAYALAHEALEWLWWGEEKCYDPHANSDVTVIL